jgi:hypothetical protein
LAFGAGGITQFSDPNGGAEVNQLTQNGFAAGSLQSVSVSEKGRLVGSYSNGRDLPPDAKGLVLRAVDYEQELGPVRLGAMLLMNGSDHLMPQPWLGRVVAEANDLQDDYHFVVTSLAEYLPSQPTDGLGRVRRRSSWGIRRTASRLPGWVHSLRMKFSARFRQETSAQARRRGTAAGKLAPGVEPYTTHRRAGENNLLLSQTNGKAVCEPSDCRSCQ